MDCEVLVHGFAIGAVVPVMKLRRGHHPAQQTEVESNVGMDERGLNAYERHIRDERRLCEAEHVNRHVGEPASDGDVHQMQPRSGKPVHHVCRVMDPMEAPEHRHLMKCAMHPVLHEVGEHQDLDELDDERLTGDRHAARRPTPPTQTASSPASSSAASSPARAARSGRNTPDRYAIRAETRPAPASAQRGAPTG